MLEISCVCDIANSLAVFTLAFYLCCCAATDAAATDAAAADAAATDAAATDAAAADASRGCQWRHGGRARPWVWHAGEKGVGFSNK